LNIWGEPNPEIHAKIRYAKWNAVRITKALKEGKDPNESNPKPEPTQEEEELLPLDPNDPEVQQLTGDSSRPRPASVEEIPYDTDRIESRLASQSLLDQSLDLPQQPLAQASHGTQEKTDPHSQSGFAYNAAKDHDVSPMEPEANEPKSGRQGSIGGGYFPEIPAFTSDARQPTLPTAPPENISPIDPPYPSHLQASPNAGRGFGSIPPRILDEGPWGSPRDFYTPAPPQHQFPGHAPAPTFVPAPAPVSAPHTAPAPSRQQNYNTDDAAVAKAQKHARFAISALTFDDVNTAVRELRAALQTLGA
jgi:vacuolar protein sorting-associated protein VTA1